MVAGNITFILLSYETLIKSNITTVNACTCMHAYSMKHAHILCCLCIVYNSVCMVYSVCVCVHAYIYCTLTVQYFMYSIYGVQYVCTIYSIICMMNSIMNILS